MELFAHFPQLLAKKNNLLPKILKIVIWVMRRESEKLRQNTI